MKKQYLAAGIIALIFLSACSSSVERANPKSDYRYEGQRFQSVDVTFSDKGKKELADNIKFDPSELQSVLMRVLETKGLLQKPSDYKLNVVINDVRVRGTFTAMFFGFMAGADYVGGQVAMLDSLDKPVHSFASKASWALGGWGGGQDSARLNWLYEKFAEITADEILGLTKNQAKK